MLQTLTPWQLLLWIVCLEILSAPLIAVLINTVIVGYFKVKESHIAKMAKALGKTLNVLKTMNKSEKEKGEDHGV